MVLPLLFPCAAPWYDALHPRDVALRRQPLVKMVLTLARPDQTLHFRHPETSDKPPLVFVPLHKGLLNR